MASIQMRTLSDNILHDTARDVREQADAADNAFERRVREMEDCKAKLMENLKKVSYVTEGTGPPFRRTAFATVPKGYRVCSG